MSIFIIFMIAVSLSMDAFSLSLAYGTLNLSKKHRMQLSSIVGAYHFLMPLLGMAIGNTVFKILPIKPYIIVFVILGFIGIQMILESFKEDRGLDVMGFLQLFIFGFAVSVDSFSVGIGLKAIHENYVLCAAIFSISSFCFTYLGLLLGSKIHNYIGKASTIIGGIVLIIIGILYLFH